MKNLTVKTGIVFILAIFMTGIALPATGQRAEREVAKEYKIKQGFSLGIDNRYGEINFVNWDKNELSVVVRITSESVSQTKADDLVESVKIDISEMQEEVNFKTLIDNKKINGKNNVKVIYDVKAPAYLNVNLKQSYGNIYIQDITGLARLEVKYGNLTANSLIVKDAGKWNSLELAYGKASVEEVNALNAGIKYSEISVSKSVVLKLESSYSKLNFNQLNELEIESKYDKISVGTIEGSMKVSSAYTQVFVEQLSTGFKEIYADMVYGNFKGGVKDDISFKIDATVSYGSIKIPEGDYTLNKEGTKQEVHGTVGNAPNPLVHVNLKYGNLELR
ncbi:MAG: hypothetical protein WD052_02760 [Bacteroidales bacterium]